MISRTTDGRKEAVPITDILISVRGWPTTLDPRYPQFIEQLRGRGLVVHDIFVHGTDHTDLRAWAAAYLDEIENLPIAPEQRQLLGYCLGGKILLEVAHQLCARGEPPRYVGLVDARDLTPLIQAQRGLYRKYRIPLQCRLRNQARLLTEPYKPPSVRTVLTVWVRATRVSVGKWRARGYRRSQPEGDYWTELRHSFSANLRDIGCPVHLYNTSEYIEENLGDATLGLAPILRGGVALRTFESTHLGCVDGATAEPLVSLVVGDLRSPSAVWVDQRRGVDRPT